MHPCLASGRSVLIAHGAPIDGTIHALFLAAAPVSVLPIGFEADLELLRAQGFDELSLCLSSLQPLEFLLLLFGHAATDAMPGMLEFADVDTGGGNFH